jgi:hypothetical protein
MDFKPVDNFQSNRQRLHNQSVTQARNQEKGQAGSGDNTSPPPRRQALSEIRGVATHKITYFIVWDLNEQ